VIIIQENISGSSAYYAHMDATPLKVSTHIFKLQIRAKEQLMKR